MHNITFGSEYEFLSTGIAADIALGSPSSSGFVVAYRDIPDSHDGTARVGQVSGTAISYGTASDFETVDVVSTTAISTLSPTKFVVTYGNYGTSAEGKGVAGAITGTIINFGTSVTYQDTATGTDAGDSTSLDASGFVVAWEDPTILAGSPDSYIKVGSVSGTVITYGSGVSFTDGGNLNAIAIVSHVASGFVVLYNLTSPQGEARVGTVSGTDVFYGAKYEFSTGGAEYVSAAMLDSTRFVVAYRDLDDSNHGTAKIGTVSGTTLTFGPEFEFATGSTKFELPISVMNENEFVITYRDTSDSSNLKSKVGTVRGTTIVFGDGTLLKATTAADHTYGVSTIPLNGSRFIVAWGDTLDSRHGTAVVGQIPTSNSLDLFICGPEATTNSIDLYIAGYEEISNSGDLFIAGIGPVETSVSCDLFIEGAAPSTEFSASGDLFIWGRDTRFCMYSDNVVFYHPVDDYTEATLEEPWQENVVEFSGGILVSGAMATSGSDTYIVYDNQNGGYPSLSGVTSIAVAFWGKDFFRAGSDAGLFVGNSSSPTSKADVNGIHLHPNNKPMLHINGAGGQSVGSLDSPPNDGEFHFIIIYAEVSGGQWRIYGSTDDVPEMSLLTNDGTSALQMSDQRYFMVHLENPNGTVIDEIICWTGLTQPFTTSEITTLYTLASSHGLRMNQLSDHFDAVDTVDLFIAGQDEINSSGDLFIEGHEPLVASSDLFIQGLEIIQSSGDLYIQGPIFSSGAIDLFIEGTVSGLLNDNIPLYINGYATNTNNIPLYIQGSVSVDDDLPLYIEGYSILSASGDLFIGGSGIIPASDDIPLFTLGVDSNSGSMDLYIQGLVSVDDSSPLYIKALDIISASGNLFMYGLSPADLKWRSLALYIGGQIPASVDEGRAMDWFLRTSDHYPQLIGTFGASVSGVTIQVWDVINAQNTLVSVTSSGCYQITDTGRWGWSTANLPQLSGYQHQYYYLMTGDPTGTFDGQFFLEIPEDAKWIFPSSQSEYIL